MMIQKELLLIYKKIFLIGAHLQFVLVEFSSFLFHQKSKDRKDTLTQLEFKN